MRAAVTFGHMQKSVNPPYQTGTEPSSFNLHRFCAVTTAPARDRLAIVRCGVAHSALALLAAACSSVSSPPDAPALPRPVAAYVIDRDWHTEFGLRANDLTGPLAGLRERFPGVQTLVFGFGDRHYLTARNPGFGDLLLAVLPAPGALLVTALSTSPEAAFGTGDVVALTLTRDGARRVIDLLEGSFAHHPGGTFIPLGDGPYPGSLYYAASITYALTHTCNTWTAELLQEGGLAVSADGVVLASQVMARARSARDATGRWNGSQPPAPDAAPTAAMDRPAL